jgi:signal transduction histidine kinase/ligand-binding sensor domain-containing protein
MRFVRHATLRLVLLLALGIPAFTLDATKSLTQYAHRIWGQEEGLFQPTIYSIVQTQDGFLWLGTQDSLIRFDGVQFREVEDGAGVPVFYRSLVRTLLEDDQRNLWAASIGGGIVRISPDGAVKRFTTQTGLPSDSVFCVVPDRQHVIWACTNQGLTRIAGEHVRVFTTADGLPSNQIRSTCEGADGTRWVAGLDFGLSRWSGTRFVSYFDQNFATHQISTALECGAGGAVWIGTSSGLLEIANGRTRRFSKADGLADDEVTSLRAESDGSLWIGTNDGISRYQNGNFSTYTTRDGLSHSVVLSLYTDREGTLWAGTKDGLDQFTDGKVTPFTTNEGLLSNDAGPVIEDAAGRLWMGTLGRGLDVFDGHRFRAITHRDGLLDDVVYSFAAAPNGGVWAGTRAGANLLANGKVLASFTTKDGLSGAEVRTLFVDHTGTLWAGTNGGLDRFTGTRFVTAELSGTKNKEVLALGGGRTVRLFVSLEDLGFYYFRDRLPSPYALEVTHPVDSYFVDHANHCVWMGSLGSGLLRWKNGVLTHVRVKDGLYDNRIYSILQDDHTNLWMASSKGIFRVSKRELDDFASGKVHSITSIPFSTGQLRFECRAGVQPAASRTRDGRLWFSTNNGFVVIDPNHLSRNHVAPPVAITSVLIDGRRVHAANAIELSPSERNLEIRYAGLSFVAPEKVSFQYILEGFDRTWIDAGNRREAFFTNLPPGDFHFRVRARNADGIWSVKAADLAITIEPRVYQRRWFFPLLAVLLAAGVTVGHRRRIYRLHRSFDMVLAERNRIARELHDTLLQGLSGITMQMQAVWARLPASRERETLREIIQDAGKCSAEARRSLWGLRTVEPGSGEFANRLARVARQAIAHTPISLDLRLSPMSLNGLPEVEYQLLRIAQEAILNSVQHSNSNTVEVKLETDSSQLELTIADNGTGFPEDAEQRNGHFGLIGMRERAAEIGADLVISSTPGKGTVVSVTFVFRSLTG